MTIPGTTGTGATTLGTTGTRATDGITPGTTATSATDATHREMVATSASIPAREGRGTVITGTGNVITGMENAITGMENVITGKATAITGTGNAITMIEIRNIKTIEMKMATGATSPVSGKRRLRIKKMAATVAVATDTSPTTSPCPS